MKKRNKIVAVLLALVMVTGLFAAAPVSVSAASNPYPTSQDVDGDGNYEIPCTWFAWQQVYENYGIAMPSWGNAVNWWSGAQNAGYATGYEPRAGAVAVWSGDYYGHVAYVISGSGNTFTVNEGGRTDLDHTSSHGIAYNYTLTNAVGATRPYDSGKTLLGFIYPTGGGKTGIDYGDDFYALILNAPCWKPIGQADNGNVELMTEKRENYNRTIWHFQKVNSRNEYKITSIYNGYSLDVYGASGADGANVECYPYHGGLAQQWFIQEKDGNTVLTASCTDKYLDLAWGSSTDGANIQMVVSNGTDAQKWTVWKLTDRDYNPELTVDKTEICVGEQATVKVITDAPYVYQYSFSVYENDVLKKTVTTPSPEYSFSDIDTGTYTIYATTKNPYHTKAAGSVSVTVKTTAELINADDYSPNTTRENNDIRYEYYDVMVPWSVAKEVCEQKGGHLVVIDNQQENDFVNQMTQARIWLGVSDFEEEGEWKTILGYLTPYSKWEDGQPDNAAGVEHYAMMRATGDWNDAPIETKMGFVCEYEPPAVGDIDLDGKITIRDVTALQRHLADVEILSARQLTVADTNGNGAINIADATHLQKYLSEFDGIVLGKS